MKKPLTTGQRILALFKSAKVRLNARDVSDRLALAQSNANNHLRALWSKGDLRRQHIERRGLVYFRP